ILSAGCPRSRVLAEVLCQKQPALPRTHHVEVAVAVDVDNRNLHSAAHPSAEIDQVTNPLHLPTIRSTVLIPIHAKRVALAGVRAVVRHVPLAGDEIEAPIAVEVDER